MTAQGYTDPAAVEAQARVAHHLDALEIEILDAIAQSPVVVNATDIAAATGLDPSAIQFALHRLDDAGRVLMKLGQYRLSEAERARRSPAQREVAPSASPGNPDPTTALTGQHSEAHDAS